MTTEGRTMVGREKRKVFRYQSSYLVCEILEYYLKVLCDKGRWIFKSLEKSLKITHVQQKNNIREKREY